jgi:gamma-glutamylcyclotransferase (GGCT)/AIG2-like uncharacterized protein YtfP
MERLFVYGNLGPGRPNVHILEKIGEIWKKGAHLKMSHFKKFNREWR